jgi:hypothetical protein
MLLKNTQILSVLALVAYHPSIVMGVFSLERFVFFV